MNRNGFAPVVVIVIIVLVLLIVGGFWYFAGSKTISGKVVDASGRGIPNMTVRAWQRDWGWNGYLVWDKDYFYSTQTNTDGDFHITYQRGGSSVHLQVYSGDYETNIRNVKNVYADYWEHPTISYP